MSSLVDKLSVVALGLRQIGRSAHASIVEEAIDELTGGTPLGFSTNVPVRGVSDEVDAQERRDSSADRGLEAVEDGGSAAEAVDGVDDDGSSRTSLGEVAQREREQRDAETNEFGLDGRG